MPRSSGEASGRVSNPLLSGMTPQQSTAGHVPGGLPIATSTPIGTPARNNLPTLPPSAMSRPLPASASSEVLIGTRCVIQKCLVCYSVTLVNICQSPYFLILVGLPSNVNNCISLNT